MNERKKELEPLVHPDELGNEEKISQAMLKYRNSCVTSGKIGNINYHCMEEATYYNLFRHNFHFRLFLLSYSTTAAGE